MFKCRQEHPIKGDQLAVPKEVAFWYDLVMTSKEVLDIYLKSETTGVKLWIDGGWGVDALLGRQTRPHKDLDIAIEQKDLTKFLEILAARGYKEVKRDSEWNFVVADNRGEEVDIHVFIRNEQGNVVGGIKYPRQSLTGMGTIDGSNVRCISAEWVIKFHSGYDLKQKDFQDVSALCKKFGIDLPAVYAKFIK